MHTSNNAYFDSREELLLELQEGRAHLHQYAEHDDAVTRLLQAPFEEPEWIVVLAAHDRRMLSTSQLTTGLRSGELTPEMLVWRSGMRAWSPIAAIAQLMEPTASSSASLVELAAPAACINAPPVEVAPRRASVTPLERKTHEPHLDLAPSTGVKQAVMGLSALIMFGVFLTMFAISSARENTDQEARSRAAQPTTPAAPAEPPPPAPRPDKFTL